jgi:DNA-binding FadR family transcriptional regulator
VALSGLRVLVSEFHHAIRLGTFYSMHRVFVEMRQSGEENENQSHSQLLEKLLSPDPDNVERVIRDHLRSGKRRLFMRG